MRYLEIKRDPTRSSTADLKARAIHKAAPLQKRLNNSPAAQRLTRLQSVANSNTSLQLMPVIQMAGHAEDLCLLSKWLVKRADNTEISQYQSREIPNTAPKFGGPFYTKQGALDFLVQRGQAVNAEQDKKMTEMAGPMKVGGKGFMILENVTAGLDNPKMRDLKLGRYTADEDDQARHGVTGLANTTKMARHGAMDKISGSRERGYRDEDQWKAKWSGDENLDALKSQLNTARAEALEGILVDVKKLYIWLKKSKVVYVGMSVLVVAGGATGKAVPIDFEHPIRSNEKSFPDHLEGLLHGVNNLFELVKEARNTYDERMQAAEQERQRMAELDSVRRHQAISAQGGSLNAYGQGNASIGNYDL